MTTVLDRERTRSTVGEVTLTFELVDYRIHTSQTTSANPRRSWIARKP